MVDLEISLLTAMLVSSSAAMMSGTGYEALSRLPKSGSFWMKKIKGAISTGLRFLESKPCTSSLEIT